MVASANLFELYSVEVHYGGVELHALHPVPAPLRARVRPPSASQRAPARAAEPLCVCARAPRSGGVYHSIALSRPGPPSVRAWELGPLCLVASMHGAIVGLMTCRHTFHILGTLGVL